MSKSEKTIPASLFEHEMRGTSKVFGRDKSISVIFEGNQAGTDGNTIIYPSIDRNVKLSLEEAMIGRGYVDHESAHIRHTDMPFFEGVAKACEEHGNEFLRVLVNCVEDVRIERLVNRDYAGAKKNLSATSDAVNKVYIEKHKEDPTIADKAKQITGVALTWEGRRRMEYDTDTNDTCLGTLKDPLRKKIDGWVSEIDDCYSTKDAYELAKRIYDNLGGKPEKKPTQEEINEAMKNLGKMSDGEGRGTKGEYTEAEAKKSKNGDEGEEKDSLDSHGGIGADEIFEPDENWESKILDGDMASAINKSFLDRNRKPKGDSYRPLTTRLDKIHHRSDVRDPSCTSGDSRWNAGIVIMNKKANIKEYEKALADTAGSINVMRRKLERAIQARALRDWDFAREQGRLDSKRLVSAYNGSPNVYKERQETNVLDTAISILVDHSGSMSCGKKTRTSVKATIALFECFTKIGVPFEVLGFNNMNVYPNRKERDIYNKLSREADDKNVLYQRYEGLHIYAYKSFKDRPIDARAVLPTMYDNIGGNNSDGEAVLLAHERLMARPEKRKILLVLSDGEPATMCHPHNMQDVYLREVVDLIEKAGTDIIGVGICSDSVRHYYPKHAICNNIEDLPKGTMDILSKALLGDRFIVDNTELLALRKKGAR